MNPRIQALADAEINRATAAMKELVAAADNDQVVLAAIQYIGNNVTTAINKEIVQLKGEQRVHKMVQNGREMLKQQKEVKPNVAQKGRQQEPPSRVQVEPRNDTQPPAAVPEAVQQHVEHDEHVEPEKQAEVKA